MQSFLPLPALPSLSLFFKEKHITSVHAVDALRLFNQSLLDGHMPCFQSFALMTNVKMDNPIRVSFR